MTATTPDATRPADRSAYPRSDNGQQWHQSLGCVPLSRVLFTPWPGFATASDLVELADGHDRFCELVGGTMVERPDGPVRRSVARQLVNALNLPQIAGFGLIRFGAAVMRLPSYNIRAPDAAIISLGRLPGGRRPTDRISMAVPEFVAEVIGSMNTAAELGLKLGEYFAAGTQLVWVIDPDTRSVRVHFEPDRPEQVLTIGDTLGGGKVSPDLTVAVSRVFDRLPIPEI